MSSISIDEYTDLIKENRKKAFKKPYDLVYDNFVKLNYDKVDKSFFFDNASEIVEKLRKASWNDFKIQEQEFTSNMLKELIDTSYIRKLKPIDAITWFVEEFQKHIYVLTLSNTQSRRSRAGKEFENILEMLMIGAGIPLDSQGNIGKQEFIDKGLGKQVDLVSPGVVEYMINKRNTVLISAKTTLRERWQEVPEEMGRTGAREMFLATLDSTISTDVLNTLYEANIQVTTTKSIKDNFYKTNSRILTFEDLLKMCSDNVSIWKNHAYSIEQDKQIIQLLEKQSKKHNKHEFIKGYYLQRLKDTK